MFLCEILTEQQQAPPPTPKLPGKYIQQPDQVQPQQIEPNQQMDSQDDEYDPEMEDGGDIQEDPFQDILPLKRYYLIEKMKELKSRLDQNNLQNSELETIIKFANAISYKSLVALSSGIISVIEDQLARLTNNAQQKQEV